MFLCAFGHFTAFLGYVFGLRKSVVCYIFVLGTVFFEFTFMGAYMESFAYGDKVFGVGAMRYWGLGVVRNICNVIPQNVNRTISKYTNAHLWYV